MAHKVSMTLLLSGASSDSRSTRSARPYFESASRDGWRLYTQGYSLISADAEASRAGCEPSLLGTSGRKIP